MVDIRYHIYSLAAVFIALALGIVIGTSFTSSSPPDESARRTIRGYAQDMSNLKSEILKVNADAANKTAIAAACQDYCRAVMPIILKGKLAWRNVAIVQTGDYDDLTGSVKQALELAGARVTSTTEIDRTFAFDDDAAISDALVNAGLGPGHNAKESRDKLFRVLASTMSTGKYGTMLARLEEAKIATFTGDYDKSSKLVVLIGGASSNDTNSSDNVDGQLIAQWERLGATVVGCETSTAGSSYVPAWHKMAIASVDNAETGMGQTALIYALNGETASFGLKESADRLIPKSMETK